jgi:hypothetical protein
MNGGVRGRSRKTREDLCSEGHGLSGNKEELIEEI